MTPEQVAVVILLVLAYGAGWIARGARDGGAKVPDAEPEAPSADPRQLLGDRVLGLLDRALHATSRDELRSALRDLEPYRGALGSGVLGSAAGGSFDAAVVAIGQAAKATDGRELAGAVKRARTAREQFARATAGSARSHFFSAPRQQT